MRHGKLKNAGSLRAMGGPYWEEGKTGAIGVSNFLPIIWMPFGDSKARSIRCAYTRVYQEEVLTTVERKVNFLEAWGPFGQGELFEKKEVQEIAAKHGKSVAQMPGLEFGRRIFTSTLSQ